MSTKTTRKYEGIASAPLGAFGVDADGGIHQYDHRNRRVVVTDQDGDVAHVQENVPRREVEDSWIPYVRDRAGWVDVWWNAKNIVEATERRDAALEEIQE